MDARNRSLGAARGPLGRGGTLSLGGGAAPSAHTQAAPTRGATGAHRGGAAGARDPLFSFDPSELDAYDLPRLKPRQGVSGLMPAATHAHAHAHTHGHAHGDGVDDAPSHVSDAVAASAAAASRRAVVVEEGASAPVSATLSLVKSALMTDEGKAKEADEVAAVLLAGMLPGAGATSSRPTGRPRVSDAGPRAAGGAAVDAAERELAAQALVEVLTLKTGEDTISFFMKYGYSCPVKFVYLKRKYGASSDVYRPYDLIVVPQKLAGDDYFVMSAKGIVHIEPGEPSEFQSLSDWMRDASAFNICTSMRFFKFYLPRKTFSTWAANFRFNRFCKQRNAVRRALFTLKPAFTGAVLEIGAALSQLERIGLLDLSAQRYTITSFLEAQANARTEAVKVVEKQIANIQASIERVCADVVKRARATDDDDGDGDETGAAANRAVKEKPKSMAAQKAEAARRAAALKAAAEEEAVLGSFVRLVDYMVVETLVRLLISQFETFLRDLVHLDHRRISTGMFTTSVRFDPNAGTVFDPPRQEFLGMVDTVVTEAIKACTSTPRVLYARQFREYVQELPTEGGPGVLGAPTVAALIGASPAFATIKADIDEKFNSDFSAATTYVTVFDAVRPIFDYQLQMDMDAYRSREHTTYSLQRDMSRMKQWDMQIDRMRSQHIEGALCIDSKRLKQELEPITVAAMNKIKDLLQELARERCRATLEAFINRIKALEMRPTVLEKFAGHVERVQGIRDADLQLQKDFTSVEDMFKLLASYDVKVTSEQSVALDDMRSAAAQYAEAARKSDAFLEERMPDMTRQLDVNIIKVNDSLKALSDTVNEGVYIDPNQHPATVLESLEGVKAKLTQLEDQADRYNKWQQLFGIAAYEFRQLKAAHRAVQLRHQAWSTLGSFAEKYHAWTEGPLMEVDVEELGRDVQTFQKTAFMLDKQLADGVSALLKQRVTEFKAFVGVITDLGNRAMKDRHWRRLYEECGQPFISNHTGRTLAELMSFGIFDYADLVTEISGTASGEAQLEASLEKIIEAWNVTAFATKPYREQKHVYILGGLDDVMTQLEDHQVMLQTMLGSRYITGVRDQVELWDRKLAMLSETLDEWIMVQKQWMYLETIFSAEDIQRQLPAEASKFNTVDKRWKDIMFRTHAQPIVILAVEHGDELLRAFQQCNATLEAIQKSLEDYLETKRAAFPRFYFLSNDELLAILSQTRDPQAVQPHLSKCFDNIKSIEFGAGATAAEMFAMFSSEGERVSWSAPVSATGNVEDWLVDVEAMMRTSLYDHTKTALANYPSFEDAVDRGGWFFTAPAQCIIVVDQIMWTQGCTAAIRAASEGDKDAVSRFLDYCRRQIDSMVSLVRGDLSKLQRTLLGAMVVIDVHARDVVAALARKHVDSLDAFEWTKQLRYYWDADVKNCVVRQTNTRFIYGYEYLGNTERLVITPLTDQCYMTLTGALHMKLGGAPAGPAGTGKTETTKDLAKALATQCVVFNCSDGIDAKMMERFNSGLAQAGAWSCFDEFNRIDIEVLSVIAQQILVIQQGLIARSTHIMFGGREIPLNPAFGVFITMNPGYAGRTELPDNLKALFRPVAMMVPDYRLIAEIILFSQGFTDALNLSNKMVQLYKLSSEQLSKQDHYDFGMRAVKSVLVAAGQLKRKEPDVDENILLIRAMRDSNVPKFLEHDLPLFRGILSDLFPGVNVPFVDYGKLQTAIEEQLDLAGLQRVPNLITKIIQTHETQLVRHGMMIVGEAGSGKTVNSDILARALSQLKREGVVDKDGYFQQVHRYTLNPKSVTMGELYGEFNLVTQEWRDGLVATLVRQAVEDRSSSRKWIIFDGPVDALWIENMNTVLDDNKMLCFSEEMQVLTSDGFMFLPQALQHWADGSNPHFFVAGFDPDSESIVYERPLAMIVNPDEAQDMVQFMQARDSKDELSLEADDNGISLVVTPEHDMYVRRGQVHNRASAGSPAAWSFAASGEYRKVTAGQIEAWDASGTQHMRPAITFKAGVRNGVSHAVEHAGEDVAELIHAELGVSAANLHLFLELYGYWCSEGSLVVSPEGKSSHVAFRAVKQYSVDWLVAALDTLGVSYNRIHTADAAGKASTSAPVDSASYDTAEFHVTDSRWNAYFVAQYAHVHRSMSRTLENDATWFLGWVWQLSAEQARHVLFGLHLAKGSDAASARTGPNAQQALTNRGTQLAILTSCPRFRDQVVQLSLHAGFSPQIHAEQLSGLSSAHDGVVSANAGWRVELTAPGRKHYEPILQLCPDNVKRVSYKGRTWCFTMPSGFLIARRAAVDAKGVVTDASRPVVVGNCLSNGERIKLPPSMHMMFEVRDLAVASPATVSRCGMVYMEPVHVGVLPLIQTWGQGEIADMLPDHAPRLIDLLSKHVPEVLRFLRTQCTEVIPSQDMNLTQSMLHLLRALLSPEHGVKSEHALAGAPRSAAAKARERYAKLHQGAHHSEEVAPDAGADSEDDGGDVQPAHAEEAVGDGDAGTATARSTARPISPGFDEDELEAELEAADAAAQASAAAKGKQRQRGVMSPDHLARVVDVTYVFAFVWSFGCNLHDSSRARFNAFACELLGDLIPHEVRAASALMAAAASATEAGAPAAALAAGADLFSYYVDIEAGALREWRQRMARFTYVPGAPYFSLLVPTVDTTRYSTVFQLLVESGRNVLFSGETGVGKSVIVADSLSRLCAGDKAKFTSATINFSAQTQSGNLQEALEANLDKKRKNLLGPPAGKRLVVFVDDVNMPAKDTYGAQPPIELLRQVIDQGGMYDRQKLFFKNVANVVFTAACAPPGGGRNEVTTRLLRHYHMLWLPALSSESMVTIFDAILAGFLTEEAPALVMLSRELVSASVEIYKRVEADLLPTPTKSHYTFNLRDLSKVFQGMLMVRAAQLGNKDALLKLWVHEQLRVFRDRLVDSSDRDWFNQLVAEMLASRLSTPWPTATFENVLFGDYLIKGDADRVYQQVPNPASLDALFTEYLDEYNVTFPSAMNLVFFRDAISHVSRISRIIRQPRGNALLVGVGGSGRRSLTRLAAFMAEFQCSTIEITRGYGTNEWHDDLKKFMMPAGIKGKDIVFVFSDTQIVKESFLEDINNILNSGDVPNLYAPDEMEQIINGCRAATKAAGLIDTRANIFAFYVQQVREHLHVVLCMSPIGAAFRTRCRQFPSLVNCCTIDWFNAWPEDALFSVARSFLADSSLNLGPAVDALCGICVRIHQSVEDASRRYLLEQRRYNYTTPTSYLELLRLYSSMLQQQRDIVAKKVVRYRGGLTKLASTNAMVSELRTKLRDLQPVLTKAAEDTAQLLVELARDQKEADAAAAVAAKDEAETAEVARKVAAIKEECQRDLDEALPAYYAAVKALKALDKKQIQEVKSFVSPPRMVGVVLEAVCTLMGYKDTWDDAKRLMNQMNFLEMLASFDKDNIDPRIIKKVTKYVKDPEFTPDNISKISVAATSLCLWVRAIYKYDEVARTIAPKKAKLAEAEAQLAAAQATLDEKRAALAKIQARVAELKANYETSLAKRDDLNKQMAATSLRLERAQKLTGGLEDESVRWTAAATQLETDMSNLVGNMILASGSVAYLGAFTAGFRADLTRDWVTTCTGKGVPVDPQFSLARLLADPVVVREWNIMGLPADDFSTENGLFTTTGRRWPLMIDPQGQANRWVKNIHKSNNLHVIKLTQPDFLRTLENAIRFGQPVLLENVQEELDPSLEPVLLKQTFKKGGQYVLRLGDTDVPYDEGFRFYITTKLANPHYMPEVCIKVTVINFTVTLRGLEDQLLVDVVRHERPELETRKDQLIISIAGDKKALKEIEDKILQMLADSTGDILEDEALIDSLAASKTTSRAIGERMREAESTTREITEARELYRPVATRGSTLYFVIADLANVNSMYQYSLQAFTRLYNLRIDRSAKSDVVSERVAVLIDDLTRSFYTNVCRGLFEVHKLLYAFLIAASIARQAGTITQEEWNFFLLGGGLKDTGGRDMPESARSWLKPKAWLALLALDALPGFRGLCAAVGVNADDAWRTWSEAKNPAAAPLPGVWGGATGLTPFQRLIALRAIREDKTVQGVREFVRVSLGAYFCEAPPFDLDGTYNDSGPQTPIIFVLSPGADPIDYLLKLAKTKGKSGPSFRIISLGQGQGPIAEKMMDGARKSGDWVCLQNCHLAVSWLPKLEALLEAQASAGGEHPDYRLWLTSMPSQKFPVPILQNGIKLTNEPPRGLKANLMRTFLDVTDKEWESCSKSAAYKKLFFGLAFYYALVLERRKFGAIGWNISYDFAASDLKAGSMQLRMYLDEQPGIPYETLNSVVGGVVFGGRVTDKLDQRTNMSLLSRYFCDAIMDDAYRFSESGVYFAPAAGPLADVRAYIESLPIEEAPEVFGLNENASITLQMKETNELIDTIVGIQPRTGGAGGGGKSADEQVLERADDVLKRLPPAFKKEDAHPSVFTKTDDGNMNSMGVFLEQEMVRFNKLTKVVRSTLDQLKKAVKGLVVMSSSLETMYGCFLFQKVPPDWEAAAYPSLKPLASWIDDLIARLAAIHAWLTKGVPSAFWISGFFFPQGFMTGVLQTYARKTRLAIDTLDFRTEVTSFTEADLPGAPANGVYVYGLYLEGARWDVPTQRMDESQPGVLFCRMPCVWLEPILVKDADRSGTYACPFYKVSSRRGVLSTTGHSTNWITTIYLRTDRSEDHWVRRGVALLSMLDD